MKELLSMMFVYLPKGTKVTFDFTKKDYYGYANDYADQARYFITQTTCLANFDDWCKEVEEKELVFEEPVYALLEYKVAGNYVSRFDFEESPLRYAFEEGEVFEDLEANAPELFKNLEFVRTREVHPQTQFGFENVDILAVWEFVDDSYSTFEGMEYDYHLEFIGICDPTKISLINIP